MLFGGDVADESGKEDDPVAGTAEDVSLPGAEDGAPLGTPEQAVQPEEAVEPEQVVEPDNAAEPDPRDAEISRLRQEIITLRLEAGGKDLLVEKLRKDNGDKQVELSRLRKKAKNLQTMLWRARLSRNALKKNPNKAAVRRVILGMKGHSKAAKMYFLGKHKRPANFTNDEVVQALVLRSLSKRAYKFLRKTEMMALPGLSTLRRRIKNFKVKPGLLHSSLQVLERSLESQLSGIYPLVSLSFDEMNCNQDLSYDQREDVVLPSAKKFHVAMVRGICHNYKQPVWCGFDTDMTPALLKGIIRAVEARGFKVLSSVSDLATTNQGLWRDMGITSEKPSFKNPVDETRDVHVFADVPHMVKLLRNHYLDRGFVLPSGAQFVREDLEELYNEVDPITNELRLDRKLTDAHFNCKGSARQRVYLATELFSKTTADMLAAARPEKAEQAAFVRLVNDAFDVLNSRIPDDPKNRMKSGYGKHEEEQNRILDRMLNMITKMRQIGKKPDSPLIPFQRGLAWSIKSAKNLFKYLKEKYKVSYLLTSHCNQDCVENAFSRIRAMGAAYINPHPTECLNRLRLLIIGYKHIQKYVVENAAVKEDDSVMVSADILSDEDLHPPPPPPGEWEDVPEGLDLEEVEAAQEVAQASQAAQAAQAQLEDESGEADLDDEEMDDGDLPDPDEVEAPPESVAPRLTPEECSEEAFKTVAGWLAYACRKKHPLLGSLTSRTPQQILDNFPWLSRISRGGLRVPMPWFLELVRSWEVEFDRFHGGKLKISHEPGVIKNYWERLKALGSDSLLDEVKLKYATFRTHARMNYLNKLRRDAAKEKRDSQRAARKAREYL